MIRAKVVAMKCEARGFVANIRHGLFGRGFTVAVGTGITWRTRERVLLPLKVRRKLAARAADLLFSGRDSWTENSGRPLGDFKFEERTDGT